MSRASHPLAAGRPYSPGGARREIQGVTVLCYVLPGSSAEGQGSFRVALGPAVIQTLKGSKLSGTRGSKCPLSWSLTSLSPLMPHNQPIRPWGSDEASRPLSHVTGLQKWSSGRHFTARSEYDTHIPPRPGGPPGRLEPGVTSGLAWQGPSWVSGMLARTPTWRRCGRHWGIPPSIPELQHQRNPQRSRGPDLGENLCENPKPASPWASYSPSLPLPVHRFPPSSLWLHHTHMIQPHRPPPVAQTRASRIQRGIPRS